jgi:hypothetical protein
MSDMELTLLEASIENGLVTQARVIWIGLKKSIARNRTSYTTAVASGQSSKPHLIAETLFNRNGLVDMHASSICFAAFCAIDRDVRGCQAASWMTACLARGISVTESW